MEEENQQSSIIFKVFSLYRKYGDSDYLGEPVNQLEHAIQCAMLAEKEGYPVEVSLYSNQKICCRLTFIFMTDPYPYLPILDH